MVDWDPVADGVVALREDVERRYRDGIDRSKVAHWSTAHDFVSRHVTPASDSAWARCARRYPDVEHPRPFIDDVREDEFPLTIFDVSLEEKLGAGPALAVAA